MFDLKYKITEADMKEVNKSLMWQYFIPYLVVSLLGLGAGIAATVTNVRTELLVLGIILIVLSAILLVLAMLLLIMPKHFVVSALLTNEEMEREFLFGDDKLTIKTPDQDDIEVEYGRFTKIKNKKSYLLIYADGDNNQVLYIKDSFVNGGTIADLFSFLMSKKEKQAPENTHTAVEKSVDSKAEDTPEESETPDNSSGEDVGEDSANGEEALSDNDEEKPVKDEE